MKVRSLVPSNPGIFVQKVQDLPEDFIRGADVSTVLSLEKSGVVFRNEAGDAADIFDTLKKNGVNYIRQRVWNNPFDDAGHGFGGGNTDVSAAVETAKRVKKAGLPLFVDFHYSDFWADPAKQQAPRAWKSLDTDKKADALYRFTKASLKQIISTGVKVGMVQIGNETTTGFCGENNWKKMAVLMNAGARAVRETSPKILVVLHFTNPEKDGEYLRIAKILEHNKVDYDVFASSWYPFWHGTKENFVNVMKAVRDYTGKKVLHAEFSWAHTYANGDDSPNSVGEDSVIDRPYPVSVQGQADCIRDAIDAMCQVGEGALGVFYWEPAWLPVPGKDYEARSKLWEEYGSGWASSYAAAYDPDDAGKYYGGSAWDNQALFDFEGKPLPSLAAFGLAAVGAQTDVKADCADEVEVRVRLGEEVLLPQKVRVRNNDGSAEEREVAWREAEDGGIAVEELSMHGVADYKVRGSADGVAVLARVSAVEKNFLDNPSFEEKDMEMWKIENHDNVTTELLVEDKSGNAKTGNKSFHFWSSNRVDFAVSQKATGLKDGKYKFSLVIHGGDADNQVMRIFAESGGRRYEAETGVDGWRNFHQPVIKGIAVTGGEVTVGAEIACDKGGWGNLDDFVLTPEE